VSGGGDGGGAGGDGGATGLACAGACGAGVTSFVASFFEQANSASTIGSSFITADYAFATKLRELAADDEPVLQLIECYGAGITQRQKVCRETGMTTTTFHNADRRLKRLVKKLPAELHAAAVAGMTRDEP